MKELKRRTKILFNITGSHIKTRASTTTSLAIYQTMIVSTTQYAPTVTVLRTQNMFNEQITELRKGARMAGDTCTEDCKKRIFITSNKPSRI